MPRRINTLNRNVEVTKVKLKTAEETIVATLGGINTDVGGSLILIEWTAAILTGKESTALVFRIRRGTTTGGTEVAKFTATDIVAEKEALWSGQCQDRQEGEIASGSYVLTVENTAAKAENGEAVQADLQATF